MAQSRIIPPPKPDRAKNQISLGSTTLNLSRGPHLMGIVNVTPDSFSDAGLCIDPGLAEEHALRLEAEGASIIDVGGESSRPGSKPVTVQEELSRIKPVLKRIIRKLKVPVSVDTYKFDVAEVVLDMGVAMINDIYALRFDRRLSGLIARHRAGVVLMHMHQNPETMQQNVLEGNVLDQVISTLKEALQCALDSGIERRRICVDPGIGFGKSLEGNLELLKGLDRIKDELNCPLLVGLSRKSFMKHLLKGDIRFLDMAHAATHLEALHRGANILRVHEVEKTLHLLRLFSELSEETSWKS
jgi:dihydropteroate synthase